jgi:LEA14-like dessication related protein
VGLAPRLTFPALSIQLNVTVLLTVSVHNPNPASFTFLSGGHTDLTYRGVHVGDAEIDPGRIPSKGDGEVKMALTLQADKFVSSGGAMAQLISDVEAGSLPVDASTRIPGRVAVFGVFKRHAVAYSDCSFVFGIAEMGVRSQQCSDHTKL